MKRGALRLFSHRFTQLISVFFVTGTLGCQPADPHSKTVKERLDAGEVVEFSAPGYRRPSCSSFQSDWVDVRMGSDEERARVIVGQQNSVLNPGRHSCFRVGSEVYLHSPNFRSQQDGLARIQKISLVKIDSLSQRSLKGKYFASSFDFEQYKSSMKFRLREEHQGIVTILELKYASGTAQDELQLKQQFESAEEYQETESAGETISNCSTTWKDLVVPEEFHSALLQQKIQSWYSLGERNCLAQDAVAHVKTSVGAPSSLTQVRIKKIKRFKVDKLNADYFILNDFDFASISERILSELARRPQTLMTVVDFQLVEAP